MNSGPAEKPTVGSPESAQVAPQYETLRMAALGEPVAPECRSGLVLFLRRGMWGWARKLATAKAPQQATRASPSGSTAPHQHRAVIQVFAAMALDSNYGRAR